MKKFSAFLLFLVLSLVFYFISPEVKAEEQAKKDILSAYLFSAAGLPGTGSGNRNSHENKLEHLMPFHLKKGVDAFIDFGPPEHTGFKLKENDRDYRAIFGLHIPLQ